MAHHQLAPYEVPLLGGLPATDFLGRQIRVQYDGQPAYYKLLNVVDEKFLTVEIQTGNGKRPVRVKVADCGPNWSRNPDLQTKAKKLREEAGRPRALNTLAAAFEVAEKPPAPPPEPVAAMKAVAPAAPPAPATETKPTHMPEEPAVAANIEPAAQPARSAKGLLSFHAPPDTDFGWTDDMKKLRLAIRDREQLGLLLQEAEATIISATAAVEAAGVKLVWDGECVPLVEETPEPAAVIALPQVDEDKVMREWADGPGKQSGEFTAAEAVGKCGLPVGRMLGLRMAGVLAALGYYSRKRPGLMVKSYYWKD